MDPAATGAACEESSPDFEREFGEQHDLTVTASAIVGSAAGLFADAAHVSITVRNRDSYETLASTSDVAVRADAAQYALKEGPCIEGADQGHWYQSPDVPQDPRWPRWGPSAGRLGVRSLLSVRLVANGHPFGALNMYCERAGGFSDEEQPGLALLFCQHAAAALTSIRLVSNLGNALDSRSEIGLAQGILMGRYGMTKSAAWSALSRTSQQTNTKLRDVAQDVIRTGGLPF